MGILEEKKLNCIKKLNQLENKIKKIPTLKKLKNVCIYVTGSYGRFEANEFSDLDLFILRDGSFIENAISKIEKTLLDAELIKITRDLGFGEFSNDGQYLEIHYLEDMLSNLGSADDDYKNFFTARLLLLLESYPLYNRKLYDKMIQRIIASYFRDYHDHDEYFRPIFLVNDIMRYYKTMCLNYEHKRNRNTSDKVKKNKAHLKNLKLKFSRLLTCYSIIFALIQKKQNVTPSHLLKIVHKTPLEKLQDIRKIEPDLVDELLKLYIWFLTLTSKPSKEMIAWIGNKHNRDIAFKNGRTFHTKMYELLNSISDKSDLAYLMI